MTSDLVKRRVADTRLDIVHAAIPLFLEHGFDATPMEAVAEAAGVSRRTLYRYFPTKDDIVFESPREWLRRFEEVVADRQPGEPTRELFLRALVEVGAYIAERQRRVLDEFTVLQASPSLQARHGRSDGEWVARYLELLAPDVADDPDGELHATVCAMALVATQNAIIAVWAADPAGRDLGEVALAALEQVDGVWPAGSR